MQTRHVLKTGLLAIVVLFIMGAQLLLAPRSESTAPKKSKEDQAIAIVWRRPEVKAWLKLFPRGKSKLGGTAAATADADKGDIYNVHVYEDFADHTATFGWYTVNLKNGKTVKQEP